MQTHYALNVEDCKSGAGLQQGSQWRKSGSYAKFAVNQPNETTGDPDESLAWALKLHAFCTE
jgi:hypothetical protein